MTILAAACCCVAGCPTSIQDLDDRGCPEGLSLSINGEFSLMRTYEPHAGHSSSECFQNVTAQIAVGTTQRLIGGVIANVNFGLSYASISPHQPQFANLVWANTPGSSTLQWFYEDGLGPDGQYVNPFSFVYVVCIGSIWHAIVLVYAPFSGFGSNIDLAFTARYSTGQPSACPPKGAWTRYFCAHGVRHPENVGGAINHSCAAPPINDPNQNTTLICPDSVFVA